MNEFQIINSHFFLPHISFIQFPFSIFDYSSSMFSQKHEIFDLKCLQNSMIFDKMSASPAFSFFQICYGHQCALIYFILEAWSLVLVISSNLDKKHATINTSRIKYCTFLTLINKIFD